MCHVEQVISQFRVLRLFGNLSRNTKELSVVSQFKLTNSGNPSIIGD